MNISIFGLGYVGCVTAACLAKEGHLVMGVDIDKIKLDAISRKKSPIVEKGLEEIIEQVVSTGKLKVTYDHTEAVLNTDVSMICVGTPSHENGSIDLRPLQRVCEEIGKAINIKKGFQTLVLRSTILPGTTEEILIPIVERASGKRLSLDFDVCVNPEFMREGESIYDFYNPARIIIGTREDKTFNVVKKIYSSISAPIIRTNIRTGEFIKYIDNSFHALKVCFANEIASISKANGINCFEAMEIFASDEKLNISSAYLRPGFAFGGSCLPKDLRAILYKSVRDDLELPLLDSILKSNEKQVQRAINEIYRTGKKRIGLLGLSFKAGTDDLRESPNIRLIEVLLGKGLSVSIYDKYVSLAKIFGKNREFIEKQIPHIACLLTASIDEVIDRSEVIVIANSQTEFSKIRGLMRKDHILIDLVGITT
ncbi:MAG: nucleotide sugar dehydrogenase [Promethearchaeota archaeon]